MNVLYEVLATKVWMMMPEYLHAYRIGIEQNIASRIPFSADQAKKHLPYCMAMSAEGNAFKMAMPGSRIEHSDDEPEVQSFVAIIPIMGPITRNGGACSYGSVDVRDAMIEAADDEACAGIILYMNSGGGSTDAIPDFRYGRDYAKSKGLPVDCIIDGLCGSACFYAASMCDHRWYINEKDQIGSIGVYAAFYTQKDGEKNEYTGETFHMVYADQSYKKNKWYRDAAEGDYKELKADLNRLADEFITDVKAACPNVTEEHLSGAVFDAKDVEGILVDGKSTLIECIQRMVSAPVPDASASGNAQAQTQNTTIDMNNYPLINAACGLNAGEMVVTEEGTHMDASLLDALEAKLSAQEQEIAELKEAGNHNQEAIDAAVAKANEEHAAAVETLNTEHAQAIENLRTEFGKEKEALEAAHTEAIAKKDEEIASLTSAKAEADEALKGAKEALATAEQTIADKDAQIAELSNDPGNEPAQGAAPQNNGEGAQVPEMKSGIPQFDPANPVESKAAIDAYLAQVRKG